MIVQNPQGTVADADSYLSVADFKTYHAARGNSWGTVADTVIEQALVKATDYLDQRFTFRGRRLNLDQTTQWPRAAAYDNDRRLLSGLPRALREAVSEYALRALTAPINPDPLRDSRGQLVTSENKRVGPLGKAVNYARAGLTLPDYPVADGKIRAAGLIDTSGNLVRG